MKYKNLVDIHTHFEAAIPNISLANLLIKNSVFLVKENLKILFAFPYQASTASLVIEAINKKKYCKKPRKFA